MRAHVEALGAGNLTRLEAGGAHIHALTTTVYHNVHRLNIGLKLAIYNAVGVANRATSNSVLTADLTNLGHG